MALFQAPTKDSGKAPSVDILLEAGGYQARVVRIIDLGKQPGSKEYPEPAYKMAITFELLDEYMKEVDAEGNMVMVQDPDEDEGVMMGKNLEDKPRWFDFEFTYNPDGFMGDRSHIYKFMQSVDAFEVLPNPAAGVVGHPAKQLHELLGEALTVNLSQYTRKSGKRAGELGNKITTFAPMKTKEKREAKPLVNPTLFFNMGEPDLEVFNKLPGGDSPFSFKNKILRGVEFSGSKLDVLLNGANAGAPADAPVENKASEAQVDAAMQAELEAQRLAREANAANGAPAENIPF